MPAPPPGGPGGRRLAGPGDSGNILIDASHDLSVRGIGYLLGVQLASDPSPYLAAFRDRGLLAPSAGNNVIRLLPPLNATPEELAKSVEIFRAVLKA